MSLWEAYGEFKKTLRPHCMSKGNPSRLAKCFAFARRVPYGHAIAPTE